MVRLLWLGLESGSEKIYEEKLEDQVGGCRNNLHERQWWAIYGTAEVGGENARI